MFKHQIFSGCALCLLSICLSSCTTSNSNTSNPVERQFLLYAQDSIGKDFNGIVDITLESSLSLLDDAKKQRRESENLTNLLYTLTEDAKYKYGNCGFLEELSNKCSTIWIENDKRYKEEVEQWSEIDSIRPTFIYTIKAQIQKDTLTFYAMECALVDTIIISSIPMSIDNMPKKEADAFRLVYWHLNDMNERMRYYDTLKELLKIWER